ncbi:MAG: helix-turn-helix transcriptional regulator [Brevundimonas sp.]
MRMVIRIDEMMARRKVSLNQLAEEVGISTTNLSLLKNGHVRGVRFNTLLGICRALDCRPGDLLDIERDEP